ncbi:hypothetical protein ABKA04_008342 [Annulohypoxylon sp. FPYF3050]
MRTSFVLLAVSATTSLATLTPTWAKLALSINLMEANLHKDSGRIEKHYVDAAKRAADNNALNDTEGAIADALLSKLIAAQGMQIKALSDLRSYLFYPESNPEEYYEAADRRIESIDFTLPEGLLETQGVFDDKDAIRAITDIPGCVACAVDW